VIYEERRNQELACLDNILFTPAVGNGQQVQRADSLEPCVSGRIPGVIIKTDAVLREWRKQYSTPRS
jgi:hypothetical protein